jgi:hypothetical protein
VITRPAEAYRFGWAVREVQDPVTVPVMYRAAGWVLLADDGSLLRTEVRTTSHSAEEVPDDY